MGDELQYDVTKACPITIKEELARKYERKKKRKRGRERKKILRFFIYIIIRFSRWRNIDRRRRRRRRKKEGRIHNRIKTKG